MSELKAGDMAMLVRGLCQRCSSGKAFGVPFIVRSIIFYETSHCGICLRQFGSTTAVEHSFDSPRYGLKGAFFPRSCVIKIEPLSDPEAEETDLTEKV